MPEAVDREAVSEPRPSGSEFADLATLSRDVSLAEAIPSPAPAPSLAQDPELLGDFILESREHLASIVSRMLVLEQTPADMEAVHSAFRGFHTIKGLAGFLQLPIIQEVAHEVETVLDLARKGKLSFTPAAVDVVLESADYRNRPSKPWRRGCKEILPARPATTAACCPESGSWESVLGIRKWDLRLPASRAADFPRSARALLAVSCEL